MDLNGSQELSEENQIYTDEIEDFFSVFEGTTPGNDQENFGVTKYPDEMQE